MSQTATKLFPTSHEISQLLKQSVQEARNLTPEEETLTRQYYLSIVDDIHVNMDTKRGRLLKELGHDLGESFGYTMHDRQHPITIMCHPWETQSHAMTESSVSKEIPYSPLLILGRYDNCDIKIDNIVVSRYHAVVFMYREAIVVLDSWSRAGTVCTDMNTAQTQKTMQNERKLLIYPANTPLHIRLGHESIIFNPQLCMRCGKNYRYYCFPGVLCEYNKHFYDQNREIVKDTISCHHAQFCGSCRKEIINYYRPIKGDMNRPVRQLSRTGWDGYSYVLKIGNEDNKEQMVCEFCQGKIK